MKHYFARPLATVFVALTLFVGPLAVGGPALDFVTMLVGHSFRAQRDAVTDLHIKSVRAWEKNLRFKDADATEHNTIKFVLSHWKFWTQAHLLELALRYENTEDWLTILEQLADLGMALDAESVEQLERRYERLQKYHWNGDLAIQRAYARLLAMHGDPTVIHPILRELGDESAVALAGPSRIIPIDPINPSVRWQNDRWLDIPKMDKYYWQNGEVVYRGVRFRSGDLVLVDLNQLFDGFNTSFTAEKNRSNFTHNGIVIFWKHNGRTIPLVLEIATSGLRVVPLARYLSPQFSLYVESYRLTDRIPRPDQFEDKLQAAAAELLKMQLGYDFNAHYIPEGGIELTWGWRQPGVVCSSLVRVLYNYVGIRGVQIPLTPLDSPARENIRRGGLTRLAEAGQYLDPTALKMTPQHQRTGVIDNGFLRNVLRERLQGGPTVRGSMGNFMSEYELVPDGSNDRTLNAIRAVVKSLTSVAQSEGRISGPVLRWLLRQTIGMSRAAIPQAPPESLALVVAFNHAIEAAAYLIGRSSKFGLGEMKPVIDGEEKLPIDCREWVALVGARKPFVLTDIENQPGVISTFGGALQRTGAGSFFRPRR